MIKIVINAKDVEELNHILANLAPKPQGLYPIPELQEPEPKPEPEPEPEPVETPTVTLETVRAKMLELMKASKQAVVKSSLAKIGATKLSDVDPAKYGELLALIEEESQNG